mmetsp:Transcript_3819/g.8008  ORF Transcript_3819/g.8008 Transcript_3819/m.8008 type:complete len:247 (+) Transcript_3819:271-1011(+)
MFAPVCDIGTRKTRTRDIRMSYGYVGLWRRERCGQHSAAAPSSQLRAATLLRLPIQKGHVCGDISIRTGVRQHPHTSIDGAAATSCACGFAPRRIAFAGGWLMASALRCASTAACTPPSSSTARRLARSGGSDGGGVRVCGDRGFGERVCEEGVCGERVAGVSGERIPEVFGGGVVAAAAVLGALLDEVVVAAAAAAAAVAAAGAGAATAATAAAAAEVGTHVAGVAVAGVAGAEVVAVAEAGAAP